MDAKLTSMGYLFEPTKYAQGLGYARMSVIISDKPTGRYFDAVKLSVPTFTGRFVRHNQITRHELDLKEVYQVCLGEINLETHQAGSLCLFSLGGELRTKVVAGDLYCELTSSAPIFKVQVDPAEGGGILADELLDLLAENKVKLARHEDELHQRLSKYDAYTVFLACLVSLQKRLEAVPITLRREKYQKNASLIKRAFQVIRDVDGWDGHSPSLEDLLSPPGD